MQSKLNIFHSLQHASDSEDENDAQKNKAKKVAEKREQRAQKDEKAKSTVNRQVPPVKEEHARAKAPYKTNKGVSEEPHPLDRHSGHGNQAYGGKAKKSGAGKGNWGNFKEDKRINEEAKEGVEGEETTEDKPQVEDKGITLSEYYQQRRQAQNEPQVNEAKAKITSEQLTKELGNATALVTRSQHQVDDRKVGKKKDRLDVDHHAAINSEHASLLNFRTGFVEKEYRQRGADDATTGPRKPGVRTGGQKEKDNAKEEEGQQATEAQTTEAQPTEGVAQAQEGESQTPTQTQGQGQDNQNRRRNEGQRGGRGGYKGDRAQGDRPQGDRPRKQYGAKDQGKINFEDESAFPKLG